MTTLDTARASRWGCLRTLLRWFAADHDDLPAPARPEAIDWARIVPFILMHLACLAVFWVGVSAFAVAVAAALYVIRMFAITGFYHRYFSHRTFRTSRVAQFVFGLLGASAVRRGPVWWAAHHRHHHAITWVIDNLDSFFAFDHQFTKTHVLDGPTNHARHCRDKRKR